MDSLCRHIRIPCTLLRMLVVALIVSLTSWFGGDGLWWSIGFGLASLMLMQIGYFAVVLFIIANQSKRRD